MSQQNQTSRATCSEENSASIFLTDEDHAIFRRMSVAAQARLHKADRRDVMWMSITAESADTYGGPYATKAPQTLANWGQS